MDPRTSSPFSSRSRQESWAFAFAHCPFRDLAEERPDLICNLHRGLVEGLVNGVGGGTVEAFGTLHDRAPCQVDLRLDDDAEEPVPVAGR